MPLVEDGPSQNQGSELYNSLILRIFKKSLDKLVVLWYYHFMKLEQQKALDILYENEGGKVILDTVHGHSRWSVSHVLIVEIDGRFYRTRYSVGATEYQDESPWQYEKEVDFVEVEPKEITVIDYMEKK